MKYAIGFFAGLLVGFLVWGAPGTRAQNVSDLNQANIEYARDLHQQWADYRLAVGEDARLDQDWVLAYDADLAEKRGESVYWEVPDIRTRWYAGYYGREE